MQPHPQVQSSFPLLAVPISGGFSFVHGKSLRMKLMTMYAKIFRVGQRRLGVIDLNRS